MARAGKTSYGGSYRSAAGTTLIVHPASGLGDVAATCGGALTWIAECKGGIVNTRIRDKFQSCARGSAKPWVCRWRGPSRTTRQFAVVPHTRATEELARRLAPRALAAGIRIALVDGKGCVTEVTRI